jgi:hypothetical protein
MLPTVAENPQGAAAAPQDNVVDRETMNENVPGVGRRRSVSNAARSIISRFSDTSRERQGPEYESEVVDLLDVLGESHPLVLLAEEDFSRDLLTNTCNRSRGLDPDNLEQRPKLPFRAGSGSMDQPKTDL